MNTGNISRSLRIFVSSTDKINNQPIYETLVFLAKKQDMAGATVLRGVMGYGASSVVHSIKFWEYSEKLPVIVEIIDTKDKIDNFFETVKPLLESMEKGCMVSVEDIEVMIYKPGGNKEATT